MNIRDEIDEARDWAALSAFVELLAQPRYANKHVLPDGSLVLDCVAYGLYRLVDSVPQETDRTADLWAALSALDLRLRQVAISSKSWTSTQEWESVTQFAKRAKSLLGQLDSMSDDCNA